MAVQGIHGEFVDYVNAKVDPFSLEEQVAVEGEDFIDPFSLTDPFDVTYTIIWEESLLQQH